MSGKVKVRVGGLLVLALFVFTQQARAVPAFARKYKTSCMTCHTSYSRLNSFGEAFKQNGYFWPGGEDEIKRKEEPVKLAAEAYKKIWPKQVWPSDIPYQIPLSMRTQLLFNSNPESVDNIKNDFQMPSYIWLLAAGTIGEDFSYFFHTHLFSGGEAGLGLARIFIQYNDLFSENIGENALNIKVGQFEPASVPFSSYTNLTLTNYALNSYGFTMMNMWGGGHHGAALGLGRNQRGIELNGLIAERFVYGLGIVNGNGISAGEETYDNNSEKDFYLRLSYKWGGLAPDGVPPEVEDGDGEGEGDDWPERSIKVGFFGYWGDNSQADSDLATVDDEDVEDYQQLGFDVTARWDRLELLAGIFLGENDLHRQIVRADYTHEYSIQMLQASYEVYPWLLPYARYELVNREDLDDMQRTIIGVAASIRANVKINAESVSDRELDDTFLLSFDWAF